MNHHKPSNIMRRSQPKSFLHEFQALKTEQLIHNKYSETHKMSNEDLKQGYPKIIIKDNNFRKTKHINNMLNIFTPIAYIKQVVVNGIMQENKKKKKKDDPWHRATIRSHSS